VVANSPYRSPADEPSRLPDPLGWWLVVVPAVAALLLPLIPFRGLSITLVVGVIALTAYLVQRDAASYGKAHPAWLVSMIVLPVALPIYAAARHGWGARVKLPHAVVAVIGLGVGFFFRGDLLPRLIPPAKVTVSCRVRSDVPKDGYICTTDHVGGYQDARACWDLTAVCASGTRITEHACAHAVVREKRDGIVPFQYSVGIDDCDAISEALVENLKVELPSGDALIPVAR